MSERSNVGVGGTQLASKLSLLSEETRHEIDHWVAKFPPGRQRSASLAALRAAQEQNQGFLTADLMDAVAEYLKLPPVQVYEVARFYSMFETHPCGRHHVSICTNISCMLRGGEERELAGELRAADPDAAALAHRSISPKTMSCVPITATTSAIMWPRTISSSEARCAKPGARHLTR